MAVDTPGGPSWPARLGYCAALIFAAASITTNAVYGWGKGGDVASALVWCGVSIAAGFVQVLAWPALVATVDRRQWGKAIAALCALVICGGYSVIAALGSASGGRTNAANQERTIIEARARTQAAYDAAKNELASLKPSRSAAEIEGLIAAAAGQWRRGCRVAACCAAHVDGSSVGRLHSQFRSRAGSWVCRRAKSCSAAKQPRRG
jgi:hypothetical protein